MEKSNKIEVASMSSRGQIVIPQDIREELNLEEGEKFIVVGRDNTIILKRIAQPSAKDFKKLLKATHEFAEKKSLKTRRFCEKVFDYK